MTSPEATVVTLEASGRLPRLCEVLREHAAKPGESLPVQRQALEEAVARMPVASGVSRRGVDAGGVPAEWLEPAEPGSGTLLYFHGGGYVIGSVNTVRPLTANLAVATGARVLSVDYRLAPEHPHPAAVDDGVTAYAWLLGSGVDPGTVAFGGDSAGGALAVAVQLAAKQRGLPLPAAAICLSPWFDLTLSAESVYRNAPKDPQAQRWQLAEMAELYLAGQDPRTPLASPVFADLSGLPPLLIQAGTAEALLDDAVTLAATARSAGVAVTLELYQDMIHVWHAFAPGLPEATATIERIAAWLSERLPG